MVHGEPSFPVELTARVLAREVLERRSNRHGAIYVPKPWRGRPVLLVLLADPGGD